MNLAQQWTFDPITVEIEPERVATENVDQRVYLLESRDRLNVLKRILQRPRRPQSLSLPIGEMLSEKSMSVCKSRASTAASSQVRLPR